MTFFELLAALVILPFIAFVAVWFVSMTAEMALDSIYAWRRVLQELGRADDRD